MVQAGVVPVSTFQVLYELQRDFARLETYEGLNEIVAEHGGSFAHSVKYFQSHVLPHADADRQPVGAA